MWRHYSIMYTQSLHTINGLIDNGWVDDDDDNNIWGFKERLHLRSLTSVINEFDDYDGQMIIGDLVGLKLPYRWGGQVENLLIYPAKHPFVGLFSLELWMYFTFWESWVEVWEEYSEMVSVSQWSNSRTPVRKTGGLRFKSQPSNKFCSQYWPTDTMGGSPGDVSENLWRKRSERRLENELWRRFTYVTAHSPTLPPLHLRRNSFSNPSVALPTSQLILQPFRHFTYITAHSPTLPSLHLRHSSFSNPSVTSPTSQLVLQPFRRFTYVTAHSPTLPSLHLRRNLFSNPSIALPTSQLILQHFRRFTYVVTHSPTLPSLYLRHSSFSNSSVTSPTSQLILQPFRRFTHVTAHFLTLPSLHLRRNSFSNPSFTLPTSQLILQSFRHFTYVATHSPTLPSLYLRHSSFSNPSVASPTSQFIVQPFFRFYVTSLSHNSPDEPPMLQWPQWLKQRENKKTP